jgi:hypothetical protein
MSSTPALRVTMRCSSSSLVIVEMVRKPKRSRSGAESMPARVVAPTSVKRSTGNLVRLRVGAAIHHDVDAEIFHRGIEKLFDDAAEAMDLVDEEHVAALQRGEDADEILRLLERRTGGGRIALAPDRARSARRASSCRVPAARRRARARAARRAASPRRSRSSDSRPRPSGRRTRRTSAAAATRRDVASSSASSGTTKRSASCGPRSPCAAFSRGASLTRPPRAVLRR